MKAPLTVSAAVAALTYVPSAHAADATAAAALIKANGCAACHAVDKK